MYITDLAGSEVKFDRQGDGLARYDILNYQKNVNSSGYHYKVGYNNVFLPTYTTHMGNNIIYICIYGSFSTYIEFRYIQSGPLKATIFLLSVILQTTGP